jgi:hypothetical protein
MNRNKIIILVLVLMAFMFACSTLGLGGNTNDDVNDNNEQSQDNGDNNDVQDNAEDQNASDTGTASEDDADSSADTIDLGAGLDATEFGLLLADGSLLIENIKSNAYEETVGKILTVHFVNQSEDDIQVALPCGLVFLPADPGEQPLMLVQPIEVDLAPGEEADLKPYVVCADMQTSAPALGSGYSIGYIENEDLLAFAQCVCEEELNPDLSSFDSIGVQFATWSISIGGDLAGFVENNDEEVVIEMLEGMPMEEFLDYFSEMLTLFGGEWLDRCGISFDE